ncbi:hypothetical protein ABIC02_007614 [Bradyrhizobium sp. RT5a]
MHPRALKRSAARCRFLLRNCLRCAVLNLRPGWIFVHAVSDHRTLKPLPSRRLGLLVRDLLSQLRPLAEPPQVPRRNCRSAQPGTLSPPLQPAQGVVVSSSTKANEQGQGLDRDPNIGSRGLWMACYRKRRWLREQDSARKPCVSSASLRRQDRPLSAAVTPNQCPANAGRNCAPYCTGDGRESRFSAGCADSWGVFPQPNISPPEKRP